MLFRVSHSTTFSRISLTKMYFFSTTPWGYDERYIQFFQNCITLQIFLEKCETLINKVLRSLKKISSHHLDQKLKLQWSKSRQSLKIVSCHFGHFWFNLDPLIFCTWIVWRDSKGLFNLGHCNNHVSYGDFLVKV